MSGDSPSLARYKLLFIDELGYVPLSPKGRDVAQR
jgi:DNA replication protein DnaC